MIKHIEISNINLRRKIKHSEIRLGGNSKLKIFGTLKCKSGKRLKRENRVFFSTEKKAKENEYRPCGNCMKSAYQEWKNGLI